MTKKILLLGSGELGKEFTIAAQRLGQYVVACDSYAGAPAMQVADECEVFSMLDGEALTAAVRKHRPDLIVPEIEAIRTERLYDFEKEGIQVTPSARAVNYTMNRKAIRDLLPRNSDSRRHATSTPQPTTNSAAPPRKSASPASSSRSCRVRARDSRSYSRPPISSTLSITAWKEAAAT